MSLSHGTTPLLSNSVVRSLYDCPSHTHRDVSCKHFPIYTQDAYGKAYLMLYSWVVVDMFLH